MINFSPKHCIPSSNVSLVFNVPLSVKHSFYKTCMFSFCNLYTALTNTAHYFTEILQNHQQVVFSTKVLMVRSVSL
jgi:hypothetical protein